MESSTLTPTQPQPQEGTQPRQCRKCRGLGEYLAASFHVGGGCYNDHWDVCPACNGTGVAQAVWSTDPRAISELEVEALR